MATEGWPPNVAKATALLHPRGVAVVADDDEPPLPFADAAFDLVVSRHPVTVWWDEIARVLRPGGTYFSQQVGPASVFELVEWFLGPQPAEVRHRRHPDRARAGAEAAGLEVVDLRVGTAAHRVLRHRRGGVVPAQGDLDGARLHRRRATEPQLRRLHERIEARRAVRRARPPGCSSSAASRTRLSDASGHVRSRHAEPCVRDARDRVPDPRLHPLPRRRRRGHQGRRARRARRRRPHARAARHRPALDRRARSATGPYGVDIIVPAKYVGNEDGGLKRSELRTMIPQAHRDFVDDILRRYDVPPLPEDGSAGATRGDDGAPMTYDQAVAADGRRLRPPDQADRQRARRPPPDMVERAHAQRRQVAALAGKAAHAVRHVAAGVDLIIAQGYEAGGHTGEIGTMVLIPEVVDAVAPVPVLAAGGIGRGRQMAAALALGAEGVWCGSVWLTTEEAETHPVVKEKFLAATSSDTLRSRSRTGKPARQLRSAWTDEWDVAGLAGHAADAAAADAHRRGVAAHRPRRARHVVGRRPAGQLLRRPDRRHDERGQAGDPGRARHGRRVHRRRPARRDHDELSSSCRVAQPAVVGSITARTWCTAVTGKPPLAPCSRTVSGSSAM